MKYTSLFSAVAIAAAMGTQALATVTTNGVGSVDFEDKAIGLAGTVLGGSWTVQNEDQSEVIYAPLSSQDAKENYTANKHLKLNTEGNELVWNPGTVNEPKSIIEMKVRLVASDTAPAISAEDTTVHAAVYLQVSEPVDASNDGLYAYTASGWSKLDAPFNAQLATGSMVALRVLMDYDARTATYEGCVLTDAENNVPVYVNLGTKNMANPTTASGNTLSTIGFKGTGGIDDLFVKEIEETPSTVTINFELWDGGEDAAFDDDDTLDTVEAGSSAGTAFSITSGLVVKTVELYENGTKVDWNEDATPTIDGEGNISVSMANYTFVVGNTYLVKVTVGEPVQEWTVTFYNNGHGTAPAAQTIEDGESAQDPGALTEQGWTFGGWFTDNGTFQNEYDFTDPVEADVDLYAKWTEASSDLESFSIGDDLPQGVAAVAIDGNYFIVNVVEPTGATASLLGSSTVDGTFTDVSATRTVNAGYTELKYTIPANEAAKFFKVKFTK